VVLHMRHEHPHALPRTWLRLLHRCSGADQPARKTLACALLLLLPVLLAASLLLLLLLLLLLAGCMLSQASSAMCGTSGASADSRP
jgi:hypothetical protein